MTSLAISEVLWGVHLYLRGEENWFTSDLGPANTNDWRGMMIDLSNANHSGLRNEEPL